MLMRRESASALLPDARDDVAASPLHKGIIDHLERFGASFFPDVYASVGGGDPAEVAEAIWDLVWSGTVTNDSLAPLRAFTARRATKPGRQRNVVATPPLASGRWYLADRLRSALTAEERALAVATNLLDRNGIATRDVVLAEGTHGGFAGLYAAFSSLEDVGSVRRGYFIEGMGGAQFALPSAVERLRRMERSTIVLSAVDPANPYGASIPWPTTLGKVERRAGAVVCLVDGRPAAWLSPNGRRIATFGADEPAVVDAIHRLAATRPRVQIATIDGVGAHEHPLGAPLLQAGFTSGYRGLVLGRFPST